MRGEIMWKRILDKISRIIGRECTIYILECGCDIVRVSNYGKFLKLYK